MFKIKIAFSDDYSQATRHRNRLMDASSYSTTEEERPRKRPRTEFYVDPGEINHGFYSLNIIIMYVSLYVSELTPTRDGYKQRRMPSMSPKVPTPVHRNGSPVCSIAKKV